MYSSIFVVVNYVNIRHGFDLASCGKSHEQHDYEKMLQSGSGQAENPSPQELLEAHSFFLTTHILSAGLSRRAQSQQQK